MRTCVFICGRYWSRRTWARYISGKPQLFCRVGHGFGTWTWWFQIPELMRPLDAEYSGFEQKLNRRAKLVPSRSKVSAVTNSKHQSVSRAIWLLYVHPWYIHCKVSFICRLDAEITRYLIRPFYGTWHQVKLALSWWDTTRKFGRAHCNWSLGLLGIKVQGNAMLVHTALANFDAELHTFSENAVSLHCHTRCWTFLRDRIHRGKARSARFEWDAPDSNSSYRN
jgi:hypothetical protein